jgi:GGDEF domain-containing protein
LLLSEATEEDARFVVERVRSLLGRQSAGGAGWLGDINASFGYATCPDDASDPKTLFRLADEAQYEAKRSGSGLGFVARA